MNIFTSRPDAMYIAAKAILQGETLDEGLSDIIDNVKNFKKGDKTNFGVVTSVEANSISFKAKDLPITRIVFNQRKMGSKDFVLDKLVMIESSELEGETTFEPGQKVKVVGNVVGKGSSGTVYSGGNNFIVVITSSGKKSFHSSDLKIIKEETVLEKFNPGEGMTAAPINSTTVFAKGLRKLWGIKMRSGKWADLFVGLFDLPDEMVEKPYGIISLKAGVKIDRYASVDDFNAAFEKRKMTIKEYASQQISVKPKKAPVIGQKVKIKMLTDWGPVRAGEEFDAVWKKTNFADQIRLDVEGLPRATMHPSIFYFVDTNTIHIDKRLELQEMFTPLAESDGHIEKLASIADKALDKAYGYGISVPGNTFGWQANLKSAQFAKEIITAGIVDIEVISDAIHKGWNETAKAFVKNPNQFSDTANLKADGKLEAKLAQRAKLMNTPYKSLPNDEKEKDRVVARALLRALNS